MGVHVVYPPQSIVSCSQTSLLEHGFFTNAYSGQISIDASTPRTQGRVLLGPVHSLDLGKSMSGC